MTPGVVVAGVGSEMRGDDGVGPCVVRALIRDLGPEPVPSLSISVVADPLELLDLWAGRDLAVVVDAARTGAPPGTVTVMHVDGAAGTVNGGAGAIRTWPGAPGTHALGVLEALRLAHALGTGPRQVVLVGVEGGDFRMGAALSAPVVRAVPGAVASVLELVKTGQPCA